MMEDYGSDTSRIRDARLQPQDCHPTPLQSHDNVVKSSAEEKLLGEIAFLVEKSSNLASDFTTSLQNNVSSSDNVSESCDCLIGFMSEVAESRTGAGVDDGRVNLDENGKGHFDCVLAAEEKIGPSESVAPCVSKVQESDALRNSSSRCIEEQLSSLRAPSVVKDDKESMLKESFLKIEEKSNSVKSGGGPTAESSIEIKGDSFNDQEGRRDSSKIHGESVAVKGHTQNVDSVVQGSGSEEIYRSDPLRGSLNIQLIDETALIQSPSVSKHGNGGGKEMDCVAHARDFERNGKKLADEDMAGKKEKKSRRRGKGAKKVLEANGKQYLVTHEVEKGGDCSRRLYPRKQMLALRFVNCEGQRRLWNEIYCGLGPVVAKEYDNLTSFGKQKPIHSGFDPRQRFVKKEEVPAIPGAVATKGRNLKICVH